MRKITFYLDKYIDPIQIIKGRIVNGVFWKIGIYLTASLALFISSLVLINLFRFTEKNLVMVSRQPLIFSLLVFIYIASLFLALTNLSLISREYDKGTLEVLMFGPVDETVYIIGVFSAYLEIFFYCSVGLFVWSNISIWIFNLAFNYDILLILVGANFIAGAFISFGSLIAVLGGKARNAMTYFVLILLLLGGIKVGDLVIAAFLQIKSNTISDPAIFLRNILMGMNRMISWISPFGLMEKIVNEVNNMHYLDYIYILIIITLEIIISLGGAVLILKKKGARG